MEATHITSNPRSGKLGMVNEDDDDDDDNECMTLFYSSSKQNLLLISESVIKVEKVEGMNLTI